MGGNKNKNSKLFLILILLLAGFFCFARLTVAEENTSDLIITEIMHDSKSQSDDWIEIYNPTNQLITLTKDTFGIVDENKSKDKLERNKDNTKYANCHRISKDILIEPDHFFVITKNDAQFSDTYSKIDNFVDSAFDLSSSGDIIRFSNDKCESFFYEFKYEKDWGDMNSNDNNISIEKIYFSKEDSKNNWRKSYVIGGTPNQENSKEPPPIIYSNVIQINEILPNPDTQNKEHGEEFVELYNPSTESENLNKWFLKDRAGKTCDLSGRTISPKSFLVLKNNPEERCTLSLNDTQGEFIGLYNPKDATPISSASYDGSAKKGLSYNFDGSDWRWSKFITPNAKNVFNNLPAVKNNIPKKIYVGMYADFSAKGSDKDKDKLKYTWDFGDGHKSYLQNTRHKYEEAGNYIITLKISDGSEDKIQTFEIAVEKFPKLDVKIVGLAPNPGGIDTGAEFLNILNNTKKKINLNGWSIASGTKNLANHPIVTDFFIKPKEIAKLTYEISKFTLPNGNGKIELRYPNGDVASKVKYKSLSKTVAENATYEKTKSGWRWNVPVIKTSNDEELSSDQTKAVQELSSLPIPTENNPSPAIVENTTPQEIIPNPEVINNLGKFSESPEIKIKQQNKFSLLNSALGIKTAQAFSEKNSQLFNKKYFFLEEAPAENYWTINFSNSILLKTNSLINKFLNFSRVKAKF